MRRRESLEQFARRYGLSVNQLVKANPRYTANSRLTKGQTLAIPVALGTGQFERLTAEDKPSRRRNRAALVRSYRKVTKSTSSRKSGSSRVPRAKNRSLIEVRKP